MIPIRRVLASVTDKSGLAAFARGLQQHGASLLSTGGTARLLRENADEPRADLIAGILKAQPIETRHAFERLMRKGLEAAAPELSKADVKMSVRRTAQALRIAVNDELASLRQALADGMGRLHDGGRFCVISFHSLEDRIVKNAFHAEEKGCICPSDLPLCACGRKPTMKVLTRKPVVPGEAEVHDNPRARSAKLRVAERIGSCRP